MRSNSKTGDRLRQAAQVLGLIAVFSVISLQIGNFSITELLALGIFGVLCLIVLRFPLVALSLLIVMTVSNLSSNFIQGFGAPSVAKLVAPGLMALLATRFVLWGDRPYIAWLAMFLLSGYVALRLFGATYALDWRETLGTTEDYVKDVIVALLALGFMGYRKGFETITVSAVLTLAGICGLGLIQVFGLELPGGLGLFARFEEFGDQRFAGCIEDPNYFAVLVVFSIPLALFQFANARTGASLATWGIALGFLVFGLLATGSRGGLLAVAVGIFIFFFQLTARQILAVAVTFGVVVVVASLLVGAENLERISSMGALVTSDHVDKSTEGRLASWSVAWEIFKSRPWLGAGAGNFNVLYQDIALSRA